VPKSDVSIEEAFDERLDGTDERLKNQMLMPEDANSVMKTPPPALANPSPVDNREEHNI
jgi:hypothetical protein